MTLKATAAETGGAFLLIEDQMERGKTTPLHSHPNEIETLFLLEGELLVHVDGTERRIGPRGVVIFSRGVPHAFLVTSETARVLGLLVPGNAEAFYRGASRPATADDDTSGPVDFEKVRESAARTGSVTILGPPPFER